MGPFPSLTRMAFIVQCCLRFCVVEKSRLLTGIVSHHETLMTASYSISMHDRSSTTYRLYTGGSRAICDVVLAVLMVGLNKHLAGRNSRTRLPIFCPGHGHVIHTMVNC